MPVTFLKRFLAQRAAFQCIDQLERDGRICRTKRSAMRRVVRSVPTYVYTTARHSSHETAYELFCDILAVASCSPRTPITSHDWRAACRVAYAFSCRPDRQVRPSVSSIEPLG